MNRSLTLFVTATLALALPVAAEDDDDHQHDEDHRGEREAIRIGSETMREFGIVVEAAGPGTITRYVSLPGEVRPNEDDLAHIVPRYSGIVTGVHARIGDQVEKGQVLALVESDESLASFEVKTLISGTVIAKHITLGEAVSRDRDAFVIADLSSVWIDLTVYQRNIEEITVGRPGDIYVGHELGHEGASITYVTPIVDERTRTATARLVLDNADGRWRPGMFVTGRVLVEREEVAVAIPASAVHVIEGESAVFVQSDEGFEPRFVQIGRRGSDALEVVGGLAAGERYVTRGGFTLKAEMGKHEFGHGHAH